MSTSDRYIRQTLVPEIGEIGQEKLNGAKVTIIGCGGLGSIVAPYLAGAGIGQITLVDYDTISTSNLHRQVFYHSGDSRRKAEALAKHCRLLNPEISIIAQFDKVTAINVLDVINTSNIVIDCTDDEEVKYIINDACMYSEKVLVYGGMHQFDGYVALFDGNLSSKINLRDCFPQTAGRLANCSEIGVFNITAGIIGLQQANTALKHILGIGADVLNKLQVFDVLYNRSSIIPIRKTQDYDFKTMLEKAEEVIEEQHCNPLEINANQFQQLDPAQKKTFVINVGNQPDATNISGMTIKEISELLDQKMLNVFVCPRGNTSLQLVISLRTIKELDGYEMASLKGGLSAIQT
ncbi:MAG TPA: HesA/MoeB/ThiF family protein [Saprospiraceae bacterium]|nr:HesA/MoeB/ThiF family protein [Saprospiraceae bacterium]